MCTARSASTAVRVFACVGVCEYLLHVELRLLWLSLTTEKKRETKIGRSDLKSLMAVHVQALTQQHLRATKALKISAMPWTFCRATVLLSRRLLLLTEARHS